MFRKLASVALLVLGVAACSDRATPVAPSAPSADLISGTTTTLTSTTSSLLPLSCPTATTATASQVIGKAGGTITAGAATLSIPSGALSSNVTITATNPAGKYLQVVFGPEGLQFKKSATLTLSYKNCGVLGVLPTATIAFTSDNLKILELLPSLQLDHKVSGPVNHFSSYMVWE